MVSGAGGCAAAIWWAHAIATKTAVSRVRVGWEQFTTGVQTGGEGKDSRGRMERGSFRTGLPWICSSLASAFGCIIDRVRRRARETGKKPVAMAAFPYILASTQLFRFLP